MCTLVTSTVQVISKLPEMATVSGSWILLCSGLILSVARFFSSCQASTCRLSQHVIWRPCPALGCGGTPRALSHHHVFEVRFLIVSDGLPQELQVPAQVLKTHTAGSSELPCRT